MISIRSIFPGSNLLPQYEYLAIHSALRLGQESLPSLSSSRSANIGPSSLPTKTVPSAAMVGALQPFGKQSVRGMSSPPKTSSLLNDEEVAQKNRSDVVLKNWKPAEPWTVFEGGWFHTSAQQKHFTLQTSNLEILCIFDLTFSKGKKHLRTLIYPYIMCSSGWLVSFFLPQLPGVPGVSFSWDSLLDPRSHPLAANLSEWVVHERPCGGTFLEANTHP